jgi:hypothetical protein
LWNIIRYDILRIVCVNIMSKHTRICDQAKQCASGGCEQYTTIQLQSSSSTAVQYILAQESS